MPKTRHEIIEWAKVLFPVRRAPHAKAIDRAIDKLVKPRESFCCCGRNCATNRKHLALMEASKE